MPTLLDCRYRQANGAGGHAFHCRHPLVVAPEGIVTTETCLACRKREEPAANGSRAPGALGIPAGPRAVYRCDVVMPYYRHLEWVPAAVDSILWQQSVECVLHLVNDDSPEDDAWLRRKYAGQPRLRWYRNRENIGPYASVHQVWRYMQTPYLAIQDSDDIALPNRLWFSIHALEQTGGDLFGAAMEQFLDPTVLGSDDEAYHREYVERIPVHRSGVRGQMAPYGNLIHGTQVVRRECFERLNGYAPDYHCGCDIEFINRAHYAGVSVVTRPDVVALRRVNGESLSRGLEHGMRTARRQAVIAEWKRRLTAWQGVGGPIDAAAYGGLHETDATLTEVMPPCP